MDGNLNHRIGPCAAIAAMLSTAAAVHAQLTRPPIYADETAAPGGDGASPGTAFNDLQAALDAASQYTEGRVVVHLAPGIYLPGGPHADKTSKFLVHPPALTSALTITIAGTLGLRTVLSGDLAKNDRPDFTNREDNTYTVLECLPQENGWQQLRLVVRDVELSGAESMDWSTPGSALLVDYSDRWVDLSCERVTFARNRGGWGAVVNVSIFDCDFTGCIFEDNAGAANGTLVVVGGATSISAGMVNCVWRRNAMPASEYGFGFAVHIGASPAWAYIRDCDFDLEGSAGIYVGGDAGIRRTSFYNAPSRALNVFNGRIEDCSFHDNHAGAAVGVNESITIIGTTFERNTGTSGAAALIVAQRATLDSCNFRDNTAAPGPNAAYGAAVGVWGELNATNCVFVGNQVHGGPALVAKGGAVWAASSTLRSCVFDGNVASGDDAQGGAIYVRDSALITNCTMVNNSAHARGSGRARGSVVAGEFAACASSGSIYYNNAAGSDATPEAIAYSSRAGAVASHFADSISGFSQAPDAYGNTGADPMFVDPLGADGLAGTADDDLTLRPASPCIDSGTNAYSAFQVDAASDASGNPRFHDDPNTRDRGDATRIDRGAYEFQGTSIPAPCWSDINLDRRIDSLDLTELLRWFGYAVPARYGPDLNADATVNTLDLLLLLRDFGCNR